jgi:hypothetical protein
MLLGGEWPTTGGLIYLSYEGELLKTGKNKPQMTAKKGRCAIEKEVVTRTSFTSRIYPMTNMWFGGMGDQVICR